MNRLTAAVLASCGMVPAWAAENNITTGAGWTATTITPGAGSVTDIRTTAVRGKTGFNSFGHFQVGQGNTVNLYVPDAADNLVNLVHDSAVQINGTLNGIKDNAIGGNILFASSHGFVLGASGVMNVGSLMVTTPSAARMGDLLDLARGNGTWNDDAFISQVLEGDWNSASTGNLNVAGKVNSAGSINLFGAAALVAAGGELNAGSKVFGATVNTAGLLDTTSAVRQDGHIRIMSSSTADIAGELAALMANGSGGGVTVSAVEGIELSGNAGIDTRASVAGRDGGDVLLYAPSIKLSDSASVSTRATGAGSSGDISLAAYSDVGFSGRNADGSEAQTLDQLSEAIAAQARPLLAATLGKAEVSIGAGAVLDAGHGAGLTTGANAGDIDIQAFAFDQQLGGFAKAESRIVVDGTLVGGDISLRASSEARVSSDVLGSILDTDGLREDIQALKTANGWTDKQTWENVLATLEEPINSYERTNDLGLLMKDPLNFTELTAVLPFIAIASADADATVTIGAQAVLDAAGDIDLQADAKRYVDTATWALPVVNSKIPFNLGMAYGRLVGQTKVEVLGGADLTAGGDLDLRALSDSQLNVVATSVNNHDAGQNTATTLGFAFSMGQTDTDTLAYVAHGASLDVDGDVGVAAVSEQALNNSASFKSIGQGATGGPAIALTLFDSSTRAVFDADLSGAEALSVSATNLVHEQNNTAGTMVGKDDLAFAKKQVMNSDQVKGFTDAIGSKVKSVFGMETKAGPEPKPAESQLRLAAALAIGLGDHKAEAIIGSNGSAPAIDVAGNVSVQALQRLTSLHNTADSTVNANEEKDDGSKTSFSIAATYGQVNLETNALVGDGSEIAAERIGVGARNEQPLDLGGLDSWSSLDEVFSNLKTVAGSLPLLPGELSTSFANATSEAQETSLSGSISIINNSLAATAWVGDSVRLEARAAGQAAWASRPLLGLDALLDTDGEPLESREELRDLTWDWAAPLSVQASTEVEQLAVAGNLWWSLFNTTADGEGGKAVGGGVNTQVSDNRSVAGIGANGVVEAGKVNVSAEQTELLIGISPSAGKGSSVAGNGAVVVGVVDSTVTASIHDSTRVEAGQIGIEATHDLGLWSAAGALAVSQETSIGAGIAANILATDVQAMVGDNRGWRPGALGTGAAGTAPAQWRVDELLLNAQSSGQSGAFGIAGALARSEQEQAEQDEAASSEGGADKSSSNSIFEMGGAVVNLVLGELGLYDGFNAAKEGASSIKDALVKAPDTVSDLADKAKGALEGEAGAGANGTPKNSMAVAGSATVNVSGQNTRARLGNVSIGEFTTGAGSDVTVASLNHTNQYSGSGAGALTLSGGLKSESSSALSGAIAYNHLYNETESLVQGVTLTDNDGLNVQAVTGGDQIAMGLGLAVSTAGTQNTAVALSASGGVMTNTTRAAVVDSSVAQRDGAGDGIDVVAYDRSRVLLGGGSFAGTSGKGTSAGGSLVFGLLQNQLQAEWLGSSATSFSDLEVSANSATRVLAGAVAGAVAAGAGSSAGSGSMFVLIVDNDVAATVDAHGGVDSSLQGGNVEVAARSVAGNAPLDALFDAAATAALSGSGLDLDGTSTVASVEVESTTDDSVMDADADEDASTTRSLFDGVQPGEAILAVAGNLAASGKTAVGGALGVVYTGSDYTASVANTAIDLDGALDISAVNSTEVLAAAVGAAGGSQTAVSGSATAIVARGTVKASLDMTGQPVLTASSLDVSADKLGGAYSLAGNIAGSANSTAVGAAFSINDMQQVTEATVSGGNYELDGDVSITAAQESKVITAALSGSVSGSGLAVGGAATFNRIADTTTAQLANAGLQAGNLAIHASQPALGASIWSLAVNLAASGGSSGIGGAVAVNLIDAERHARISDSSVALTGSAELVSALDGEIWGIGADVAGGSSNGIGGSIVVNNIDGSDTVSITNSNVTTSGAGQGLLLDASAGDGLTIASLTGSIKGGGSNAVGGAISVNRIGADRTALVDNAAGNRVAGFEQVDLLSGAQQDIYAIAVAGGGAGNVAVNGSSTSNVLEGTERAALLGGSVDVGSLNLSAAEGDRTIWSLAGAVSGAGSVAVGVANANNIILAKREAEVRNAGLTLDGDLDIASGGGAGIRSAAVGGGGAGTAAAGASIAVNVIEGEETALLADSTVLAADSVSVEVLRGEADIKTLAGNVQGAGTGAGAGAVAISTIGQVREARIQDSNLATGSGAVDVHAATRAIIDTIAVSGAAAGTGALAFSNTSNNIDAQTRALVQGSGGSAGLLDISASDTSEINAFAGSVAGAGTAAVGGATAINRVGSDIEAALTGNQGSGWGVSNLLVDAHSAAAIQSAAVSGAGSGTAAVAGSVATNVIQTQSSAHVGGGAQVVAQNNIGISARNIDSILGVSGGLAASGNASVGASVTVNLIETDTRAYIDGETTQVSALAVDAGDTIEVDSGGLLNAPGDDHEWISGDQFNPAPNLGIATHRVNGLSVQASSVQQLGQISLTAAASFVPLASASVAGLVNTSVLAGSTSAYIADAGINQAAGAGAAQDVRVGAASHSFSAGYLASLSFSLGAAAVAGTLDTTAISRTTRAGIHGAILDSRGQTEVEAESTQFASGVVAAAGGGIVGAAGAVGLTILSGTTEAVVDQGSQLDVGSLRVAASALQSLAPNVATIAGGAVGVGGTFALVHNLSNTRAWVGESLTAPASAVNTRVDGGAVEITASNDTRLQMIAAGAAGGGVGVAGSAAISVIETETVAGASQADFGSAGRRVASLDILAEDSVTVSSTVGTAAVGGVSVGASANVLVANSATRAMFDRSTLHASGSFDLQALRSADIDLNTVTGSAAGGVALGGSLGLLVLGSGSTSVNAEGESVDPMQELNRGGDGTLAKAETVGGADKVGDIGYQDYRRNPLTGEYELVDATDSAAKGSVNGGAQATVGDRLSATSIRRHETLARVGGGSVIAAGGATGISATDQLDASNLVGNAAVGGLAGVGGAFGLSFSNAYVNAEVLDGSLAASSVDVSAQSLGIAGRPAVTVDALSGAAGFGLGLGAAVGVAVVDNTVGVTLGGNITSSDALTATAEDRQDVEVDAKGAAAGVVGAGLVLGVSAHDSVASMDVLSGATLRGTDIDLAARSQAAANLVGRGGAGGILAGVNATVLVARDDSEATLEVGSGASLLAARNLELLAEARPHVTTDSLGISLGGLLSAGATIATAAVNTDASLNLGANARLQATNANLASRVGLNGGRDSVNVQGLGISGGVGISINAVVASATNNSTSLLQSADSVRFEGLGNGLWSLVAGTEATQRAATEGYAAGLLTVGASVAEALAQTSTQALVNGRFSGSIGGVTVAANAAVDNQATSEAGQGGLVSGAAATARTRDEGTTRATLLATGASGGVADLGHLVLSALHQSTFNAFVNSTNAALVGMSGAWARNHIDLDTSTELLGGSRIVADSYEQNARNEANKAASSQFNVQSGSGGVFDAAAAISSSELWLDARSDVAAGARLKVDGDWRNPEHLKIGAFNQVVAFDSVKLDSGGAIAIARAESLVDVKQADASVGIGSGADLYSIGDLVLAASGRFDIDARTNAKTWGLAGAAQGLSLARVDADYGVDVAGGSQLFAYGDLKYNAGYDLSGGMNKATLVARTDLWNNTAFPVVNDPEAEANYQRDSSVNVAANSSNRAVGDVYLQAGTGYSVLTGEGVGKDLYREGLGAMLGVSLDISGGSTINGGRSTVVADGSIEAGVYSQQKLHVSGLRYYIDGVLVDPANVDATTQGTLTVAPVIDEISDGIEYRVYEGEYSQLITARLAVLQKRMGDYGLSPLEKTAFQAEINLLNQTLAKIYTQMGGNPATGTVPQQLKVWVLEVDPILARPGNIHVKGDSLAGTGLLSAPGDAKIEILNGSAMFLDLQGLTIPDREGGQLLFNNARMNSNADIAAANRFAGTTGFTVETAQTSPLPQITVRNSYNPATGQLDAAGLKPPAPDIYINGTVSNKRGNIELTASYGSIYANADIRGQSLSISAGQDFVLNNMDGFTHIGGDPAFNNNGATLTGSNSSTVAGNNVIISALYLNINGLIQSGVEKWAVTLNESDFANLPALRLAYQRGGAAVVQLAPSDALNGRIGYSYDFRSESVVLDTVEVNGGYMELTGHIMSTGNGQLKVLDGYSQVEVVNNTTRQLNITGIDLGNGVEGQLRINDVARKGGNEVWSTIYTHNGNSVQRYEGWSGDVQTTAAYLQGATTGRNATYDTTADRTYVWLEGRDRTDTTTEVRYWDGVWDFFPAGSGTVSSLVVVEGENSPIDGAEYMGNSASVPGLAAGQVDVKLDNVFVTDGKEVISQSKGGYCKTHFIWCQVYRTTQTTVSQEGLRIIDRYSVRADSDIAISFIGFDTGKIDLTSNGNVSLLGSMFNDSGTTNVTINGGSLTQANDGVLVTARTLVLDADGGIGDAAQSLRVQAHDSLDARSAADISLAAINGGVNLAALEAGGDVFLSAQGDITSSNGATVTGQSIELVSSHGNIGSAAQSLRLDTGSNERSLFSAEAVGGIFVEETVGDLWVDRVAAGGNVHVKVADGDLLDGNSSLAYESRDLSELQALWATMGLSGADADAALAEQKQTLVVSGRQRYDRYWQLRGLAPDGTGWAAAPFDPAQAAFDAAQVAQMRALGWDDARIGSEQQRRTSEYQAMHAEFGALAYRNDYVHVLGQAELAQLEGTAHWTEDELRYSISSSLLNRGSGGNSGVSEQINISGRDVTLEANRVGRLLTDDVVIDLTLGPAGMTTEQRAALARAEYDDVYFDDETNPTTIRIVQRDDVNISATGLIRATATGDVYLGGEHDFNIRDVQGHTIQIRTDGSIVGSNGSNVVIRGHDVVLEAARSEIRGDANGDGSLHLEVDGNLTARARVLDMVHHGNLSIQRLTGTDSLDLRVLGDLSAYTQLGENLLGGSVNLAVTGNAGSATKRIQIGTGGVNDLINLDVTGNAWIGGLQGALSQPGTLRIGTANTGGMLDIGQTTDLFASGDWAVGGLALQLGNQWRMLPGSSVLASNGIFARVAGSASLGDLATTATGSGIDIEADSLAAAEDGSQWLAKDLLRLRASGGDIGTQSRPVTAGAARLDVASTLGQVYMDLLAGIGTGSIQSAGSQWLRTLGNVALANVSSGAGDVNLTGTGQVRIDALQARGTLDLQGQDLVLGTAEATTGDLLVDLSGSFEAGTLVSGGDWTLHAASATADSANIAGDVDQDVSGHLQQRELVAGGNWRLEAGSADTDTATIGGDVDQSLAGLLQLGQLDAGGHWDLQGRDATVGTAVVDGQVRHDLTGDLVLGSLQGGQDWTLVAANALVGSATLAGHISQTLAGDLTATTLVAGGNWTLDAASATVDSAGIGGSVDQQVSDHLQQRELVAGGDWTLQAGSAEVEAATIAGNVDQRVDDHLQQRVLDAGGNWGLAAGTATVSTATIAGNVDQSMIGLLDLGQLDAGGHWNLQGSDASVGTAVVAGPVQHDLAGDLRLGALDAAGTRITAFTASRIGRLGIDGDLLLQIRDRLDLGTAAVTGSARLDHTGATGDLAYETLRIGGDLDVTGPGDWTGGSAIVTGSADFDVGSADLQELESLQGDLALRAARALAVGELHSRAGQVDAIAATADLGNASAAATLDIRVLRGPLSISTGTSGGNLSLTAQPGSLAAIHFGTPADPAAAGVLLASHLRSGQDLLVQTDGDVYGGNAEAVGEVRIIGRNLGLGRAQSLESNVYLQAEQDISALMVEARQDVGIVAGGNLHMPGVSFDSSHSLKAGRDLTVGIGGDLVVDGVAQAGRDIDFTVGGQSRFRQLVAGRHVEVDSVGSIVTEEGVAAGGRITLGSRTGAIGSGAIVSTGAFQGAPLQGAVNLEAARDIEVTSIRTGNGGIEVRGHSLLLGSLASSQDIDLLARGMVRVGSSESVGYQDWRAGEGIEFDRLLAGAQAYLDSLLDTRGRELHAAGGALLHAGWRSGQASNGSVMVEALHAPKASVFAGNRIRLGDARIGESIDVHGRDIEIDVTHTGPGALQLWVEGSGAPLAERIIANIDADNIQVPRYYAMDGTIRTTSDLVRFEDARGVDRLDLYTANAAVLMNNLTPLYRPGADVQLYELDKAFQLEQRGLVTWTNAYVEHRKDGFQVLVPNFEAGHGPDSPIEFQRNSAAGYSQQHLSGAFTDQRTESLRHLVLARGLAPAGWASGWWLAPVESRMNLTPDEAGEEEEEERNLGAML